MNTRLLPLYVLCASMVSTPATAANNNLTNPSISVILDGQYRSYDLDPEEYELPGFSVGGEAGLGEEGFSLGHSELTMSSNIDQHFYGQLNLAIAEHEGETEVELEEAYVETIGLSQGFTIRGGRFFSAIGYQNQQHAHAWDFADAPLVYDGLWGRKYIDDGLRVSWLAPTDTYIELGVEAFSGGRFPAGGEKSNDFGSSVIFATLGDDIDDSNSWQLSFSYYSADVESREAGGHAHEGEEEATETPSFTGDSDIFGTSFVYKWAPNGNSTQQHFKLQLEYFKLDESGDITLLNSDPLEASAYEGDQSGYYIQAIYQFMPHWRTGLRYDSLDSNNTATDEDVLAEAGLDNEGIKPERVSAMIEWIPSEFSRIRLQYNIDDSYEEQDKQVLLQYTMSLGSHGAHQY